MNSEGKRLSLSHKRDLRVRVSLRATGHVWWTLPSIIPSFFSAWLYPVQEVNVIENTEKRSSDWISTIEFPHRRNSGCLDKRVDNSLCSHSVRRSRGDLGTSSMVIIWVSINMPLLTKTEKRVIRAIAGTIHWERVRTP